MATEVVVERQLETEIVTINQEAQAIAVVDAMTYEQAAVYWKGVNDLAKKIKAYFEPLKESAHQAHKMICDREKEELMKLKPTLDYLNEEMTRWRAEEEKRKAEEEARLREVARKAEEEARLAAAVQAEAEGSPELAAKILEEPLQVATPTMPSKIPKVSGVGMATSWKAEVYDLMALVKAVAEGQAPHLCLLANQSFLDSMARQSKGVITYPGVRIITNKSMRGVRS